MLIKLPSAFSRSIFESFARSRRNAVNHFCDSAVSGAQTAVARSSIRPVSQDTHAGPSNVPSSLRGNPSEAQFVTVLVVTPHNRAISDLDKLYMPIFMRFQSLEKKETGKLSTSKFLKKRAFAVPRTNCNTKGPTICPLLLDILNLCFRLFFGLRVQARWRNHRHAPAQDKENRRVNDSPAVCSQTGRGTRPARSDIAALPPPKRRTAMSGDSAYDLRAEANPRRDKSLTVMTRN
jgi:hypothetical protein